MKFAEGVSGAVAIVEVDADVPVVVGFGSFFVAKTTPAPPSTRATAAIAAIMTAGLFFAVASGEGVDCVVSREAPRSVDTPGCMMRVLFGASGAGGGVEPSG